MLDRLIKLLLTGALIAISIIYVVIVLLGIADIKILTLLLIEPILYVADGNSPTLTVIDKLEDRI